MIWGLVSLPIYVTGLTGAPSRRDSQPQLRRATARAGGVERSNTSLQVEPPFLRIHDVFPTCPPKFWGKKNCVYLGKHVVIIWSCFIQVFFIMYYRYPLVSSNTHGTGKILN